MSDTFVQQNSLNKYLKGKLHSMTNFIIRNIVKSVLGKDEKICAIKVLQGNISSSNFRCFPLSISDFSKQVIFKLPASLIYYITLFYQGRYEKIK